MINTTAGAVLLLVSACLVGCAGTGTSNSNYRQVLAEMDAATAKHQAIVSQRNSEPDAVLLLEYQDRIKAAIEPNWLHPDGLPPQPCVVHITQLPGGAIVEAAVDDKCPYDRPGRQSVENAVLRTRHLPYYGFERVWQRQINFVFRAQ